MSKSSSGSVVAGSCFADTDLRSAFALRICSRNAADDFEGFGDGLLEPVLAMLGRALLGVLDEPAPLEDSCLFTLIFPETVLPPFGGSFGVLFALNVCGGALSTDFIIDAFVGD